MTERYMRAYYYTFTPTGNDAVDAILEAIALAGKAYHNTCEWGEPAEYDGDKNGPSYWDAIQEAANKAALPEALRICPRCLKELPVECGACPDGSRPQMEKP